MTVRELGNCSLKTIDIESRAVIFSDDNPGSQSLPEFVSSCIQAKDECGDLYAEPWESKPEDCLPTAVPEEAFWRAFGTMEYFIEKELTDIKKGSLLTVLRLWDEWNNKFFVLETNAAYYGISWVTTA